MTPNQHFQVHFLSCTAHALVRLQYTLAAPEVFVAFANPVSLPSGRLTGGGGGGEGLEPPESPPPLPIRTPMLPSSDCPQKYSLGR